VENKYLDEAWNNSPHHRVYGFQLRPFCLYYLHLLQSVHSPLLRPGVDYGPIDLFRAAQICSSPFCPAGHTLYRVLALRGFRKRLYQFRIVTTRFHPQADRWLAYYQDYLSLAKQWVDTGEVVDQWGMVTKSKTKAKRRDLDNVLATVVSLIDSTKWSEETIMMMPIGKAYAICEYLAISKGAKISYVTEEEEAAMEAARKAQNGNV
jgi:hypothetical protein